VEDFQALIAEKDISFAEGCCLRYHTFLSYFIISQTGPDMAMGPVFITQLNPTRHSLNPTQPIDEKYFVTRHHNCNVTT